MHVKPKTPETVVRDPRTRVRLPADGGRVPDNSFWLRRLIAGDVVKMERPDEKNLAETRAPNGGEENEE